MFSNISTYVSRLTIGRVDRYGTADGSSQIGMSVASWQVVSDLLVVESARLIIPIDPTDREPNHTVLMVPTGYSIVCRYTVHIPWDMLQHGYGLLTLVWEQWMSNCLRWQQWQLTGSSRKNGDAGRNAVKYSRGVPVITENWYLAYF